MGRVRHGLSVRARGRARADHEVVNAEALVAASAATMRKRRIVIDEK